ncbi:hypothetical protein Pmar_PMAR028329 [Perkinsus marinus ATCC 50983]|uniref:25S rRNA (uridine-N(3))-methyltransferase BMT5-like domain-containing protein n=1 Tax=Perkinsus marinus (strain ATCC 50983 / TXsc) TaxID=423536 RepID=C5KSP6_PERM5|nr:hypothetical protein Pmar_PMAR028329 [Perkinsus marinus ATCC 50983]EER12489.1 hypothetical protein Pmar_PMAR028329 [Perkinsus marinus ATCC 50983]|eukprot:XP_002780694.1 hypothetical protein Pmar_PMAR028329 [Perkinsus marinus ATCC 50983]
MILGRALYSLARRRRPADPSSGRDVFREWYYWSDGNLSYSRGLAENINGVVIYATTYEGEQELNNKYTNDVINEHKVRLIKLGHKVYHNVDATDIHNTLIINNHIEEDILFNRIIFMHPLVCDNDKVKALSLSSTTTNSSSGSRLNVINMLMLTKFLISSSQYLSINNGQIWITIKNVYPYKWWNIPLLPTYINNTSHHHILYYIGTLRNTHYQSVLDDTIKRVTLLSANSHLDDDDIGDQAEHNDGDYDSSSSVIEYSHYYQPRNVDRNAAFHLTSPITYIFQLIPPLPPSSSSTSTTTQCHEDTSSSSSCCCCRCRICDITCTSIHDLSKHKDSRKHKQRYQLHLSFINALRKEDIGREVGVGGGTHDDDPTTILILY